MPANTIHSLNMSFGFSGREALNEGNFPLSSGGANRVISIPDLSYSEGVGALVGSEISWMFLQTATIPNSGSVTWDLYDFGGLRNTNGDAYSNNSVKVICIKAVGEAASKGGVVTLQPVNWSSNPTGGINQMWGATIKEGRSSVYQVNNDDGWPVTQGSDSTISLSASGANILCEVGFAGV